MSTDDGRTDVHEQGRWIVPVLCVVLGIGMLAIQLAQGEVGLGIALLAIMWGYGAVVVLLRQRSELGELMAGGMTDERRAAIQVRALAVTGQVLILALVGGFVVQMARGADTQPWVWLGALGGATDLGSLAVIRLRS